MMNFMSGIREAEAACYEIQSMTECYRKQCERSSYTEHHCCSGVTMVASNSDLLKRLEFSRLHFLSSCSSIVLHGSAVQIPVRGTADG